MLLSAGDEGLVSEPDDGAAPGPGDEDSVSELGDEDAVSELGDEVAVSESGDDGDVSEPDGRGVFVLPAGCVVSASAGREVPAPLDEGEGSVADCAGATSVTDGKVLSAESSLEACAEG